MRDCKLSFNAISTAQEPSEAYITLLRFGLSVVNFSESVATASFVVLASTTCSTFSACLHNAFLMRGLPCPSGLHHQLEKASIIFCPDFVFKNTPCAESICNGAKVS